MIKLNLVEPLYIEEQLRYRCCYNYKTHCRYIAAILALTAVVAVLTVCLALQLQVASLTQEQQKEDPGPESGETKYKYFISVFLTKNHRYCLPMWHARCIFTVIVHIFGFLLQSKHFSGLG